MAEASPDLGVFDLEAAFWGRQWPSVLQTAALAAGEGGIGFPRVCYKGPGGGRGKCGVDRGRQSLLMSWQRGFLGRKGQGMVSPSSRLPGWKKSRCQGNCLKGDEGTLCPLRGVEVQSGVVW